MNLHPNERTGIPRLEVEDDEFREEENGQEKSACVFCSQGQNGPKRENDSLFPNFVNGWGILLIIGPNPNIGTK